MNQITVVHPDSTTFNLYNEVAFCAPAKATQKMALLSDDLLSITVNSATPLSFCLGDIINVYGKGYRLNQLPGMTKQGNRIFTYELQLEGAQYDLLDVTFQLPEGSYGDNLYGDLSALVDALKWNVRRVFGNKWNITTALTGTAHKNLAVTGKNCLQVAQELCSEFGVEFMVTITGNTVTMEFVKTVGTTLDLTLRYGQGNGLYQLQRTNVNNAGVTTRLFCYGSSENLGSGYRHTKLCLPNKTRLTSYIEDAGAIQEYGVKEGEKVFSDIRPERIGHVTAVASGDVLSFYDSEMDFDLNAKDPDTGETLYLLPETAAQIKFISGNLGGYTFDLHSYDHATKKFTINQFTDENGVKFPDAATAARQFSAANGGDEYIITDIQLPQSYIDAAETKLQEEGTAALEKICQPQVSYKLTLDENFFIDIYGRTDTEFLHVGDSVTVVDSEIGVNKAVRITRIERDLLRPHSYDITLSDTVTKNTTIKVLNDITEITEVIQNSGIADTSKMRRRWMATKELQEMVFDPDGYFDADNIKPLSIETAMLTVACKSQQFTLVGSLFQPNLGGACNDFYAQGCRLVHYALFDEVVTFTLSGCTYSAANGNPLNTTTAYYIYARCSKVISNNAGTGDIILSTVQHMADETSYYYFLIGVLNSAVDGVRAISLTYGATTINGAFITTGRIQSQDENSYIDLDNNAVVMGNGSTNELSWNKNSDGKLRIKGGLVVNDGGDEGTIGLYRGVYNATYTYYPGDEVTYTVDGVTSTYRHTGGTNGTTSTRGIAPTNTTYWQIRANGVKGQSAYKSTMFVRMNNTPTKPADAKGSYATPSPSDCLAGQNSGGTNVYWSDGIPAGTNTLWATTRIFTSDGQSPQQSGWSTPRPMTDTDTYDVEFAKKQTNDATPATPTDSNRHGGSGTQIWFDPVNDSSEDFTVMYWRAERECKNGVWGDWTITRIKGEKGDKGLRGDFKARCFKRTNTDISGTTPTGGTYDSPVATGWSDGIPSGTAKLWSTVCIFYGDGTKSAWSAPSPETDTATLDVEFSPSETQPSAPTGSTPYANHESEGWYDPNSPNFANAGTMIWRAERKVRNGVYEGSWTVSRIYGEKGEGVNPNILLRTIFDKGISKVQEAWISDFSYTGIDAATDTVVEGRKSIRLNAASLNTYLDFKQNVYSRVKPGTWYTLSFNYFATAQWNTYIYANTDSYTCIDKSAGLYVDGTLVSNPENNAFVSWAANWEGKRHTITFKTKSGSFSTQYVYIIFRAFSGGQVAICMPKLEEGKKATGYVAHEDDLTGTPGVSAPYYKYKYQWSGSRTAYPTPFNPSALNAGSSNWKDSQPTQPGTLYYLWRTTGKVSADGTTLVENWTTPIRVTPTENTLQIEVKGTKHNGTSSQAPIVRVYGSDITGSYGRGHNLKVLNASDLSVAYEGSYDTYTDTKASQTNTTSLYNKLMQYASEDYIIVVYSYDALSMLSKLYGVLQKFGCNYRTPELIATRFAFAFIGRWGFTPGQGYTKSSVSEETVEIAASVIDGKLVANGSDGVIGDNLIDNSETPETFGVTDSSSAGQFFTTGKIFNAIPEGQTISGQARITLSGCTFPSAGASILLYLNSQSAWPRVCEITGITANGTYDLKTELTAVPTGISTWEKPVWVRLNNFYTGGTITIERVKVEVGAATEYSLSVNDRRGASTPYRGAYDSNKTYYGTARRTDVVKYDGNYYVARADVGTFTNKVPTNTDYWNDYGAQFESVATQLLFAEFAYVENLGVRDLQTAQSGRRVHVSADDNAMTIYDDDGQTCAVFSGDQFDDGELFGGADVTVSPKNVDRTYRTGDALHPNMQYQETVSCGTFNFGYAGVFTGSCRLSLQSTGSYSMGSGTPSRMFHATIELFVDNSYIGSWSIGDVPQESALYVSINKAIAAGNHSISARITIENPNYTSGSYQVTAGAIFTNCKASADIRMARYFANGQALGCSSSQYMEALLQTVGSAQKLLYKVRAGNCGIRFYDGTMQIMIAGTWYTCSRNTDGTLKLTAS